MAAGIMLFLTLVTPYGDWLAKNAIRKFCKRQGWTLVKIQVNRKSYGVTYAVNGEKKYGKWPEDFGVSGYDSASF